MTENEERWGENAQVTIEAVQQDFSEKLALLKEQKKTVQDEIGKKELYQELQSRKINCGERMAAHESWILEKKLQEQELRKAAEEAAKALETRGAQVEADSESPSGLSGAGKSRRKA